MCPPSPVTACPLADGGTACEETVCTGPLWITGGTPQLAVQFRILDPQSLFSAGYAGAIRAAAAQWKSKTSGFVKIEECFSCSGKFISVVPGDGDGIMDPNTVGEQHLPMPVAGGGSVSPHWIAHQWGHVVGLSHTYQRADRDRYVGFDPNHWCPPGGPGLPPRCTNGAATAPFPAVATGTFGVFDEKSKMNGLPSDGVCGAGEPDEYSSEPTIGDVSAARELVFETYGWSPFLPIGRSVSLTAPLDYQLAPGVDPVGSPAIAEVEYASPEIFVHGSDDNVYATRRDLNASPPEWTGWTLVAEGVDADPAVVYAPYFGGSPPPLLFLAVRTLDGNINLKVRTGDAAQDDWSAWTALGAPPAGAASAPAVAAKDPYTLVVVVRGGDGLIYWLPCTDAIHACVASATGPDAWKALPPPSSGIFVSKPSAVWPITNLGLAAAAVRDDGAAQVIMDFDHNVTDWLAPSMLNVNGDLAPDDPNPGVAITFNFVPNALTYFARNQQGLLVGDTTNTMSPSIGGVLLSPPAVVTIYYAAVRTDVAAIIDDHGHPGVWWRFNDASYTAPCSDTGAPCAPCGP
jgi:hypothetical protein